MSLSYQDRINPDLPNFADRFYPQEDSPEWRAQREELRMIVLAVSQEESDPQMYETFITTFLIPNVVTGQTPSQLQSQWKAYFDRQGSSLS